MDFHGLPWTLMDTKLPMGMEFHGHPWTLVDTKLPMGKEFHRHPWTPMDIDQMAAPMDTNFPQPRSVKVHGFS